MAPRSTKKKSAPLIEEKTFTLELETIHGDIIRRESSTLPPAVELSLVSVKAGTRPLRVERVRSKFVQVDGCKYKEDSPR